LKQASQASTSALAKAAGGNYGALPPQLAGAMYWFRVSSLVPEDAGSLSTKRKAPAKGQGKRLLLFGNNGLIPKPVDEHSHCTKGKKYSFDARRKLRIPRYIWQSIRVRAALCAFPSSCSFRLQHWIRILCFIYNLDFKLGLSDQPYSKLTLVCRKVSAGFCKSKSTDN
jgi:hypothetical protein